MTRVPLDSVRWVGDKAYRRPLRSRVRPVRQNSLALARDRARLQRHSIRRGHQRPPGRRSDRFNPARFARSNTGETRFRSHERRQRMHLRKHVSDRPRLEPSGWKAKWMELRPARGHRPLASTNDNGRHKLTWPLASSTSRSAGPTGSRARVGLVGLNVIMSQDALIIRVVAGGTVSSAGPPLSPRIIAADLGEDRAESGRQPGQCFILLRSEVVLLEFLSLDRSHDRLVTTRPEFHTP